MAKLELNRIVASTLDNFIIFNNSQYTDRPFVDFTFTAAGIDCEIVFQDSSDPDAFSLTIVGGNGTGIDYQHFNTAGTTNTMAISFMECLKLNNITYNVRLLNENTVRAYLDTSRNYAITATPASIQIGDSFSNYKVADFNKFVLNAKTDIGEYNLEKYVQANEVPFKVTSIFDSLNLYKPVHMDLSAYSIYKSTVTIEPINQKEVDVLPTTMTKFETIDYEEYFIDKTLNHLGKFLTDRTNHPYNYGEITVLSVITNYEVAPLTVRKKYYTNSGMFLTQVDSHLYKEHNGIRVDLYTDFDLDSIEAQYDHQVAFVDVVLVTGTRELTEPLRYVIQPKCNDNYTLYFVNRIGGLDSYNFNDSYSYESKIKDNETYYRNNIRPYDKEYVIENTRNKAVEITHTYTSTALTREMMEYLTNNLQRSKYVYQVNDNFDRYIVVVDGMDVSYNSEDKNFECSIDFYSSDENKLF